MKQFSILLTALVFIAVSLSAQEKSDTTQHMHNMKNTDHKAHGEMGSKDSTKHMMHNMKNMDHKEKSMKMDHKAHGEMEMMKGSLVRKGEIDLTAIDKNGDKKVFQDQMDWNVISDEAGNCPICEMKLKEVSIYEAKAKLIQNGFKVKDFSGLK